VNIQEILGSFLSAYGEHELARLAYESTTRNDWVRLGDETIRRASEHNRTHTAHAVKLALDNPKNGGPGRAVDFEMRSEQHCNMPEITMWRAWMIQPEGPAVDCGLASADKDVLKRRIVGSYVARKITVIQ
jgi:hypothetical protein